MAEPLLQMTGWTGASNHVRQRWMPLEIDWVANPAGDAAPGAVSRSCCRRAQYRAPTSIPLSILRTIYYLIIP